MDDLYNGTMLRRWSLDLATGRQECAADAVDTGLISADDRAAVEAVNADVHAAIDAVEAYEAALRSEEGAAEPPPAEILALAALRAGEATESDAATVAARWPGQATITLPTPEEIARRSMPYLSPRQIRLVMLALGLTDAAVDAKIDAIPDAGERAAAHIEWQWATTIRRTHPLVESLRVQMDFPPDQFDSLWLYGAAL